ncbi:MAG: methionine gamma-lyase family protein, partial [Clostridia bacterium]
EDIIQIISLLNAENVISFCKGIQSGSPIDSFATPEPCDMPGYTSKIIMAAGAFTQGSSIELSADAPIRPPYDVYLQGGLTYESGKYGIMTAAEKILERK